LFIYIYILINTKLYTCNKIVNIKFSTATRLLELPSLGNVGTYSKARLFVKFSKARYIKSATKSKS